jgi:hypothetical protein
MIESSETDPHKHNGQTSDKGANTIQWNVAFKQLDVYIKTKKKKKKEKIKIPKPPYTLQKI